MSGAITMANGTYPITDQHSVESAWKLRANSKVYSEAQVMGHVRLAVKKLGLTMPGPSEPTKAAMGDMSSRPHGFVFPSNMPPCAVCGHNANDPVHVNPPMPGQSHNPLGWGRMVRSELNPSSVSDSPMKAPRKSHAYSSGYTGINSTIPCLACGGVMGSSIHAAGMPAGQLPPDSNGAIGGGINVLGAQGDPLMSTGPGSGQAPKEGYGQIVLVRHAFRPLEGENSIDKPYQLCALCGFAADDEVHGNVDNDANQNVIKSFPMIGNRGNGSPQGGGVVGTGTGGTGVWKSTQAFVTTVNGRTIVSAPGELMSELTAELPPELTKAWQATTAANPNFMWIEGRFVEADQANRNSDYWSSNDLEMGEPTVAHGPLNWLHEERHIIGTLAGAKLVKADRAMAAAGERTHIRSLAAVWRYLWPMEARIISMASDSQKLWYSMECISKTVSCQTDGCGHEMPYGQFMSQPGGRCAHVKAGGARRYVEPRFLGGAVIVPPKSPGWGGANATVMRQAAMLAEGQQHSFDGMTTTDAELMVAAIINYASGGTS